MESLNVSRYIQEMDKERTRHIKDMHELISIPAPTYLNQRFKLNPDSVELPNGFSDYVVKFVRKGLQKIKQVTRNPQASLGVLLSGGVDSSVALQAGYNAVNKDLVALTITHTMLGEQEKVDHEKRDSLVSRLKIREVKQDITPIIEAELKLILSLPETIKLFKRRPELFEIYRAEAISRARTIAMLNYCSLEQAYMIDTGNLTESSLGQSTIGDSSGFSINILSLLLKGEVRRLGKELGLGKEFYEQEKRTGEFSLMGNNQLGASDDYFDPIVNLYLNGASLDEISRLTQHDPKWLKKLERRFERARIVRATNCPIINLEENELVPTIKETWQQKIKTSKLAYELNKKRRLYMPK